jgi:5-methylcytosine-specific restriction enzyme subunit McrC
VTPIPIRNIYYLLCYAWDHVQERRHVPAADFEFAEVQDLLGHVLANATARLIARGLDRSYVPEEGAVAGVRGKLQIATTIKQRTLWSARTWCGFDEFRHDILPNRILKASLGALLGLSGLDESVRGRVRGVYAHLDEVQAIELRRDHFRRLQLHRNNRLYDFALRLCRLLFDSLIVDQGTGKAHFRDFVKDEARMGQLFEDFVFNFYRREQRTDNVSRPHIQWHDAHAPEDDLRYLPIMRTDVVLRGPDRTLVVDTKFYADALSAWRGGEKVRSAHLYQVFTYLENLAPEADSPVEGMLLYPAVKSRIALDYRLKGHRIRVCSVDLAQPWPAIHEELLTLIRPDRPPSIAPI